MSPCPGLGTTIFTCPMCNAHLHFQPGTQVDPTDGVTVFCLNPKCPTDEVAGHGNNEKAAYQIVKEKYKP